MAGNSSDFKAKGITVTDNLKYMDRIETQERRLTGNERIDLKRKSRLETEEHELRARHARDQIWTEGDETPEKETKGWTRSERKALKRKGMIWNEKGWLETKNRLEMQDNIVRRWCNTIANLRYFKSTNPFSMIWKITQVWKTTFPI